MTSYYFDTSILDIEKRLGALWKKSGTVLANATKRAAITGRKVIEKETTNRYNLLKRDVASVLKIVKDKDNHHGISYKLVYEDSHRNLLSFSTGKRIQVVTPGHPVIYTHGKGPDPKYFKANVLKATGSVPLNGSIKPFVQKSKNRIALFERTGTDPKSKIRGVGAPSIPQVVKNKEVIEKLQKETKETLQKRIDHEITRVLKGY